MTLLRFRRRCLLVYRTTTATHGSIAIQASRSASRRYNTVVYDFDGGCGRSTPVGLHCRSVHCRTASDPSRVAATSENGTRRARGRRLCLDGSFVRSRSRSTGRLRRLRRESGEEIGHEAAAAAAADYVTRGRDEADHGRPGSAAPVLYTRRLLLRKRARTR